MKTLPYNAPNAEIAAERRKLVGQIDRDFMRGICSEEEAMSAIYCDL